MKKQLLICRLIHCNFSKSAITSWITFLLAILLIAGLNNSRAQNTWTQKTSFGGTERYGVVGFSIGSKGYMGTGFSNYNYYKDFWEYDPATDAWTQKADFG